MQILEILNELKKIFLRHSSDQNFLEYFTDEEDKILYLKRYKTLKSIFEICKIDDDFEITNHILEKIINIIDKQKKSKYF